MEGIHQAYHPTHLRLATCSYIPAQFELLASAMKATEGQQAPAQYVLRASSCMLFYLTILVKLYSLPMLGLSLRRLQPWRGSSLSVYVWLRL